MYKSEFGCDFPVGRDRFCRIIDGHGLKVRLRIRKPRTTDSTHGLPTYPNLVKDFIAAVAVAVDFYNNRRPHMSIGMMTPAQASETTGDRDMKWTSRRLLAIKSRNSDGDTEKTSLYFKLRLIFHE